MLRASEQSHNGGPRLIWAAIWRLLAPIPPSHSSFFQSVYVALVCVCVSRALRGGSGKEEPLPKSATLGAPPLSFSFRLAADTVKRIEEKGEIVSC